MEEVKKKISALAIIGLTLGCLSLIPLLGALFYLPAILISSVAMVVISRNKDSLKGKGLAITGLALSLLAFIGCAALFKITVLGPSDSRLISSFQKNKEEYEVLRTMFIEDNGLPGYEIRNDFARYDDSQPSIDEHRKDQYRVLLNKLGVQTIWDWKSDKTIIAFLVDRGGMAYAGNARWIIWSNRELDKNDVSREGYFNGFSLIEKNWYLLREAN